YQQLGNAILQLQPNDAQFQAQFTLRFAEVLVHPAAAVTTEIGFTAKTPTEAEAEQQTEQGKVFSQMATQIRQTQELSLILKTAIAQVRSFLQADRVVIYQFESELAKNGAGFETAEKPVEINLVCGRITYEDRADASIPRILNLSEGVQCFIGVPDYKDKYRKGAIQAIDDIRITYAEAPCLVNLLEWSRVRAKLVVPIVFQEKLWGLLIVHQCLDTRHWLDSEIRFLQCVAELLSIAIYQSQLNSQLQQQAQTLEQRVIERTQELHDALNAAQSANLTKTEFLASVSHELRTPLTAIIGMSTTLLRLPSDSRRESLVSAEKQQEYLKIIRNSGGHLLELINDILDLSKVEAGRTILDVQEFSLTQVAQECMRMLRDKAQQSQITLELDLRLESSDPNVSTPKSDRFAADPRRVKQILLNLLSNAIKFTPPAGQVTLRVWLEAGTAIFQVEDTGIGIPDNQFHQLFKKFQQLDRSYHRQYEGTGLGLALTKQLVELHGGRIEVESVVDVGSTFTVWLPAQPLKTRTLETTSTSVEKISEGLEGRVVLVENNEAIANLICDLLTAAGHQVIWMIDGVTALHQIEIINPEVVIADTRLAGMSVHEMLQRLRQNAVTQDIKVLLLHEGDVDRDHGLAAGADVCLAMPLNHPEELLDSVQELITRRRMGQEAAGKGDEEGKGREEGYGVWGVRTGF
ncbi:MAG: GAF domain-containing protein, partial [Oscillatoriales cyanobacterium C42_A2020_001]|nr:GAF domain-containing protein [Leptolyngbyaceae cyanobacterium C42_A2020_001]